MIGKSIPVFREKPGHRAHKNQVGREYFSNADSLGHDLLRGMGQAVRGAITEDRIVEEAKPFSHSPVDSDDEAAAPMPGDANLVGARELLGSKAEESQVAQDHQLCSKG